MLQKSTFMFTHFTWRLKCFICPGNGPPLFPYQLVNDYLRDNYYSRLGISGRNVRELNVAACRLMLDITPGLETSAVFETVRFCISWLFFYFDDFLGHGSVLHALWPNFVLSLQPSNDALVNRLFSWAKDAPEPLQTYATGLLSAAMEVQDIAVVFRYEIHLNFYCIERNII